MANRFRGSSKLIVEDEEGGKTTYELIFDANALVEFEEQSGINLGGIIETFSDPKQMSMKFVRSMLWAGLQRKHPETTIEQAGDILSDAGMEEAMKAVQEAFGGATRAKKVTKQGN